MTETGGKLKTAKLILEVAASILVILVTLSQLLPKLDPVLADIAANIYDVTIVASLAVLSGLLWLALTLYRENLTLRASLSARTKAEPSNEERRKSAIAIESSRPRREKTMVLPAREIQLERYGDRVYGLTVDEGATLHAKIDSSGPVDGIIVDQWHFTREDFDSPDDFETEATKVELLVDCEKDTYFLLVVNTRAEKVTVRVEAWTD